MRKDILNSIIQMKEVKNLINKSEIARRFNCSINTVNKYLNIQESNKSTRKYSSKLDDFKGIIIEKLMTFLQMVEQFLVSLKIKVLLVLMELFLNLSKNINKKNRIKLLCVLRLLLVFKHKLIGKKILK